MRLDGIRLFLLTAKYLNITQAARELRISQSAASRRLSQLEDTLGTKLFKKNGRGLVLTAAGEIFLHEISPVCSQIEDLEKKYSRGQNSITIAASYRPSKYLLPALITEFSKKHPLAKMILLTCSSVHIDKLLLDSEVDLAVSTNPTVAESIFATELYCHEPLMAFVAADHPLAQIKSLQFERVGAIPIIIKARSAGESRTETQLPKFEKEGIKFKTVVRCDSPDVAEELVRRGVGMGFLYYNSIKPGIESGEFKVVQIPGFDLAGQNYIVYSKEKALSSLAREFLSFLRVSVTQTAPIKPLVSAMPIREGSIKKGVGNYMRQSILRSFSVFILSVEWITWLSEYGFID